MKDIVQNLLKLQEIEFAEPGENKAEAAISDLRRKVPQPILEHYDRLIARGKKGVAAVNHQVCTGCHMRVPIGAIITLMHDTDIQVCDNCGRYLYLPPESRNQLLAEHELKSEPAPPSAPKTVKKRKPRAPLATKTSQAARVVRSPAETASQSEAEHVSFDWFFPKANQVFIAGPFNNWQPSATPLKNCGEGRWLLDMALPPGKYEFRFFVDGQWTDDPGVTSRFLFVN
jgi:hypothetical protein